tara:strand:- start:1932 stop:2330 length:399 start_codon:yes stop_codon:yes gene_type:complete
MRILLILISLTFFGGTEEVNWENLEKIYFFEKMPENFETRKSDQLIQLPEAKELKTDIVKNRLKNSKYEGTKYIWKGGSYYGIAVFNGGETIKLKMSSNYGVYRDMSADRYYSIEGFETLGSMNWEELIKKE